MNPLQKQINELKEAIEELRTIMNNRYDHCQESIVECMKNTNDFAKKVIELKEKIEK